MLGEGVVVLFGGDGSEHRVSVASAQNVASLLEEASLWFWGRDDSVRAVNRAELLSFERAFERDFAPSCRGAWKNVGDALDAGAEREDVFFLALHGGSGEDGTIQQLFEERGLAFTGSGAEASRTAFDKRLARERVAARGVRVADAVTVTADTATHERLARLFERHGKVVWKPVADGSSHGVRILTTERELGGALTAIARSPTTPYFAEAFIEGRELTVGVVEQRDGLVALPCSEVVLERGRTFDYEGKYLGKGVREITPADVPPDVAASARKVALAAHDACGCRGYSRTDVIMADTGPVFLEVNTLPGLTRASFIPQQLAAAGIPMRDFLLRQIEIGRARSRGRQRGEADTGTGGEEGDGLNRREW